MAKSNTAAARTTEQAVAARAGGRASVLERCVCLTLLCSYLGAERSVGMANVDLVQAKNGGPRDREDKEVGADKSRVSIRKRLVDRSYTQPVHHLYDAARDYLKGVATASHKVFGPGTYLVPLTMLVEVDQQLETFRGLIEEAVEKLVAEWPEAVAEGLSKLGTLGRASDYATQDEVRAAYTFDWRYVTVASPDKMLAVDHAILERSNAQYQKMLTDAADEVVADLRAGALRVMQELAERLAPDADGKARAVRGTALDDLQEFCARLPHRNFMGDDRLDAAVREVAAYAQGLDAETLKKAPVVKAQLMRLAEQAAGTLDALVQETAGRAIAIGGLGRRRPQAGEAAGQQAPPQAAGR